MENDNIIPMSSRAIDLPVSPLRATSAEGELLHAPVVATLMSGKTVAGRLAGLDGPRAIVTLQTKDHGRTYVRFSELRFLNFIARNPINRGKHPLQQGHARDIVMPKATQEFRISFTDQKVLTGRTRASFVDKIGIHLFQLVDSAHVSRLFVPTQAVQHYYIGQRREARSEQLPAGQKAPPAQRHETPAQGTPRRRKSDRQPRKEMATDTQALKRVLAARDEGEGLAGAKRIGEMLVEDRVITQSQLDAALKSQKSEGGARIGQILVRTGVASAEQIYTALAHKFGMPFVLLRNFFIDMECLGLVPADIARRYTLVPLLLHEDRLVVAMDDPANTEALTLLRFMTKYHVEPTIATREDIEWAIGKYYGSADRAAAAAPERGDRRTGAAAVSEERAERNRQTMEKAVASFIANTVADAVDRNAADVHLIAERDYADLLFRINGMLVPVRRFNRIIMPAIMDHLRAMGGVPPADGTAPQSGRARVLSGDELIDAHILIDRQAEAETAVIRLIRTGAALAPVARLGLQADESAVLDEMLARRGGMIVVAGLPEAQRSRTLYAVLREVEQLGRRVATAESPVSYYLSGIEQLHPRPGEQDFAARAFAEARNGRIDGLLIGEIGDGQTLQAAVAGALRGTAVLAKAQAATAAQAIAGLMALAGDRADLAAALSGVLVQHKLRVNCRHCLEEEAVDPAARAALGAGKEEVFYRSAGCEDCKGTGDGGSQLVFELLAATPPVKVLIEAGAPALEIHQQAADGGMMSVAGSALELARLRRISFAEAHRLFLQTRID